MIVLGLDTATHTAGIAIYSTGGVAPRPTGEAGRVPTPERLASLVEDDDRVLAEARHDTSGRGADLLVKLDELCRGIGLAPTAFDAIAIGAGPGSFTGLRIGMATAKGIAFAAGRPLWAVSSLAALADDARREVAPDEPIVCAALDARRGEVFAGCTWRGVALGPERVMAPGELGPWVAGLARAADPHAIVRFAGDALDAHRAVLAPLAGEHGWLTARTPSGVAIARLAIAGARVDITVGGAPTYIRPSEAEVMYPDGVPGALPRRT